MSSVHRQHWWGAWRFVPVSVNLPCSRLSVRPNPRSKIECQYGILWQRNHTNPVTCLNNNANIVYNIHSLFPCALQCSNRFNTLIHSTLHYCQLSRQFERIDIEQLHLLPTSRYDGRRGRHRICSHHRLDTRFTNMLLNTMSAVERLGKWLDTHGTFNKTFKGHSRRHTNHIVSCNKRYHLVEYIHILLVQHILFYNHCFERIEYAATVFSQLSLVMKKLSYRVRMTCCFSLIQSSNSLGVKFSGGWIVNLCTSRSKSSSSVIKSLYVIKNARVKGRSAEVERWKHIRL